ncbi:thioesterase family protein [Actinomadura sp. NPDC047616]|uniref:thioesterase family protein n=1 Tax=Actinomadura sp. NPDC047616 TaxID=3155914 RepID=UPI0033DACFE6
MKEFSRATAVRPRNEDEGDAADAGERRVEFDADLDAQWSVGDKLHGGYVLAVMARAAARAASPEHPHPAAVSATFLRAPDPGPVVIAVDTLREGRTVSQLRVRMSQDDRPMVEALICQERLEDADPWWSAAPPVELPDRQDCFLAPKEPPGAGFPVPLMEVVEEHVDPGVLGFALGEPSRRGLIQGWQRLADGTDWDPFSLLVALDMVPPASYDLALPGWAPTIQLTAYIRRLPAPGPVRVRMRATDVGGDRIDETVHVWDSKDRLVAQATQLAAVRIPS